MGMEVNNSRLTELDPGIQTPQQGALPSDSALQGAKGKPGPLEPVPDTEDVNAFEQSMKGHGDRPSFQGARQAESSRSLPSAENLFAGMFGSAAEKTAAMPTAQGTPMTDKGAEAPLAQGAAGNAGQGASGAKATPDAASQQASQTAQTPQSSQTSQTLAGAQGSGVQHAGDETNLQSDQQDDHPLAAMFASSQAMPQAPATSTAPTASVEQAAPMSDPDGMDTMVNKMVDRILVSEPGKGQQEVRISLNDSALKGTEVTLTRAPDGQLMVKLTTSDAASFQTLVGAQDSLRAALERNGQNVRVEAQMDNEQQDNNPNQRSRTYQEYQPYDN